MPDQGAGERRYGQGQSREQEHRDEGVTEVAGDAGERAHAQRTELHGRLSMTAQLIRPTRE